MSTSSCCKLFSDGALLYVIEGTPGAWYPVPIPDPEAEKPDKKPREGRGDGARDYWEVENSDTESSSDDTSDSSDVSDRSGPYDEDDDDDDGAPPPPRTPHLPMRTPSVCVCARARLRACPRACALHAPRAHQFQLVLVIVSSFLDVCTHRYTNFHILYTMPPDFPEDR